jgi:hypothetical protein
MTQKNLYVIQPYRVGPKDRKSLVMGIPAAIAKKYKIDRDTIFILKAEMINNRLILEKIIDNNNKSETNIGLLSADLNSEGSSQQITNQAQ